MANRRFLIIALGGTALGGWACGKSAPSANLPHPQVGVSPVAPQRTANSTDGVGASVRAPDANPTTGNPLAPEIESSTAGSTGSGGEVEAPSQHGGSTGSGIPPFHREAEQAPA